MAKDDMEIVSALQLALADKVGTDRYELWFGAQTQLDLSGDALEVRVATPFYQDWLRRNFRSAIEETSSQVLGRPIHVSFRVDASLVERNRTLRANPRTTQATRSTSRTAVRSKGPATGQLAFEFHDHAVLEGNASSTAGAPVVESDAAMSNDIQSSPQLATDAPAGTAAKDASGQAATAAATVARPARRPLHTLESFVGGPNNHLALASACKVVNHPGSATPLLLYGPTGVGKSHLLEGIIGRARRVQPQLRTLLLTAEQFTSHFMGALHGSGFPSFRMKYRGVELLAIDDIQFFVGKRATALELLHTIDALLRDGRQVVLTADRPIEQLHDLGGELVARLQGGLTCRLDPADFETRLEILRRKAARLCIQLPDDVAQFLARRITSHARALVGALRRLALASEALGRTISTALAEETLADLLTAEIRQIRLEDIDAAMCSVFSLEARSLQTSSRGRRIDYPRTLAMWLARKHTRAALSEIGSYFGRRSHSTVISAQKKVDQWLGQPGGRSSSAGQLPLDEALRRVERLLGTA